MCACCPALPANLCEQAMAGTQKIGGWTFSTDLSPEELVCAHQNSYAFLYVSTRVHAMWMVTQHLLLT